MSKVKSLSEKTGDARYGDILSALKDAESEIGVNGAFKNGKKVLILALDDTDSNFAVSFIQSGMKMSECISLCETAKTIFLSEMNYI